MPSAGTRSTGWASTSTSGSSATTASSAGYASNYKVASYDRTATRALIKAIRATAPGHVKLIYFNDPVLIKEGLVRPYAGHDDHLHIRYCEKVHFDPAYDC